jgi:tetratricopeptide (TPR) repeat protein
MADLPGGATPELVEALFGFEGVHAMEALRRRRLVYRDGRRYQTLVPVRHFAAEKTVPEAEAKRPEVDDFLLALARDADERWVQDEGTVARLMQAERPNVEAALRRAATRGDDEYVAALASAAARALHRQFGQASSKHWLEEGREAANRIEDAAAWAKLTYHLGEVARMQSDHDRAAELYREARAVYREIGVRLGEAHCTHGLGEVAWMQDDYDRATELFQEARAVYREIGDRLGEANCMRGLGDVALAQSDYDRATELFQEARAICREIGDRLSEANCMRGLGDVTRMQGDHDRAAKLYREARAVYREIGFRNSLAAVHYKLGLALVCLRQPEKACHALSEAERLFEEIKYTRGAQRARDAMEQLLGGCS